MKRLARVAVGTGLSIVWAVAVAYFLFRGWLGAVPELIFVLLTAVPVSFFSIKFVFVALETGRSGSTQLRDGTRVAKFKTGARIVGAVLVGPLVGCMFWFAYGLVGTGFWGTVFMVMFAATGVFILFEAIAMFFAVFRWNQDFIEAPNFWGSQKRHLWEELGKVGDEAHQSKLRFKRSGTARISKYCEGYEEIMELAESKLNNA